MKYIQAAHATIFLAAVVGFAALSLISVVPAALAHEVSTCPSSRIVRMQNVQFSSDHIVVGEIVKVTGELVSLINRQVTVEPILPIIDKERVIEASGGHKYFSGCDPPPPPASRAKDLPARDWQIANISIPAANSEGLITLEPGANASFSIEIKSTKAGIFHLMFGIDVIFNTANGTETGIIYLSQARPVFVLSEGLLSAHEDRLILITEKPSIIYLEPSYFFGNVSKVVEGDNVVHVTFHNSSGQPFPESVAYVDPDGFFRGFVQFSDLADENYTMSARYEGREANANFSYTPGFVREEEIYETPYKVDYAPNLIALTTDGIIPKTFAIHREQNMVAIILNSTQEGVMELSTPNTMTESITAINATIFTGTGNYTRPVDWKILNNTGYPEANPVIRLHVPSHASEVEIFGADVATQFDRVSSPEDWSSSYGWLGALFPIVIGIGVALTGFVAFMTIRKGR